MGFTGMKERAKMIGAEINIAALPNEGVKITLKYNLK
jgi:signal transduction histidine kinase